MHSTTLSFIVLSVMIFIIILMTFLVWRYSKGVIYKKGAYLGMALSLILASLAMWLGVSAAKWLDSKLPPEYYLLEINAATMDNYAFIGDGKFLKIENNGITYSPNEYIVKVYKTPAARFFGIDHDESIKYEIISLKDFSDE